MQTIRVGPGNRRGILLPVLSDDLLWKILLFGAAVRLYGPSILLIVVGLVVRKKWAPSAADSSVPKLPDRHKLLVTGAVVTVLAAAAAVTVFVFVAMRRGPLGWDEATYFYKAYGVSEGIRHMSVGEAWNAVATGDQLYPPVSSFALGAVFAVFGSSQTAALVVTALGFVASTVLLFAIGCYLDEKKGHLIGLIAALLFLGTPLIVEYAGTAMLEMAGIVATLLALIVYLHHLRKGTELTALATGIALALVFFTKYNYGLFTIGAVAACQLTRLEWKPWTRENLWLWVPVASLSAIWFRLEGKWDGFVGFATNHDMGMPMLSERSLLFYPRFFFAEYTSSTLLGAMTIVGGFAALFWIRRLEVRAVFLFFAVSMASLTVHHLKEERYLATVVPVLFLLSAFTFVRVAEKAPNLYARNSAPVFGLLLLVPSALLYARDVPRLVSQNRPAWSSYPWPYRGLNSAMDFALNHIDPSIPTTFAGTFNEWSPETIRWRFATALPGAKVNVDFLEAGRVNFVTIELMPGSPYRSANYLEYNATRESGRLKMQARIKSGKRLEAVYPSEGLRLTVFVDAVAGP